MFMSLDLITIQRTSKHLERTCFYVITFCCVSNVSLPVSVWSTLAWVFGLTGYTESFRSAEMHRCPHFPNTFSMNSSQYALLCLSATKKLQFSNNSGLMRILVNLLTPQEGHESGLKSSLFVHQHIECYELELSFIMFMSSNTRN